MDIRPSDAQNPLTGTIEVEHGADGPVLHMCGDVDAPVVQRFETEQAVDRRSVVAVEFSEMAYIDSIGLSFLVRWAQERSSAGHPAVIRNVGERIERVLYIAGIDSMFARED
ncbi:MAG TPA: STAS domain-containing protein [Blastococcus sp.]